MLALYLKNISQLLFNDLEKNQLFLREIGLQALEKAIYAVKPKNLMEKSIYFRNNKLFIENDEYDLQKFKKIYIIGGGKATAEMVFTLEKILISSKDIDYEGIINIPENSEKQEFFKKSKIFINPASHPIPNESGVKGTKSMMEIVKKSTENDLIFCLISGGGSALLTLPKQGIKLEDLQKVNSLLLSSGASIHEINIIRKHLSDFKGGNLVKKLYNSSRATLISLIISDVVGDNLDSIASGPTVPDKSTFKDALEILKKYELLGEIPNSVKKYLEVGVTDKTLENPKPNDDCFTNVHNYLIGSVISAVEEIKPFLNEKGFVDNYFSNEIIGEATEFGKSIYSIIRQYIEEWLDRNKSENLALIGTGELTVTIRGNGVGGRNQEMLLGFLNYVKDKKINYNFLIIGANLDGIEGNSEAMGALVDNYVLEQIISTNIDLEKFLENNNSNGFFKQLGVELITGPTGCNVNDLVLILLLR
ncbi:MAG: glycerate kinase [Candidatus Lokiarchaeota archaeon]|nr:glycerate kinase [Candidatus Lokiarchaeota archaeon]